MLPPGHIAAGYLTAYALTKVAPTGLSPHEVNLLLWVGAFFGFAPDIDMFWAFWKTCTFKLDSRVSHREFWTHAPVFWLIAGLGIFFAASTPFWKCFGLLVWLASWSHFLLDSIEYGVQWLWPFRMRRYAIYSDADRGTERDAHLSKPFFHFYWHFVTRLYSKSITVYLEAIVVIAALLIYFRG